jgi:hypothetical protein
MREDIPLNSVRLHGYEDTTNAKTQPITQLVILSRGFTQIVIYRFQV